MTFITETLFRAADARQFLRRVLAFDAVTSGAMGLMLVAGAGLLGPLLDLPRGFVTAAGAMLLPFAAVVGLAAFAARPPRPLVWAIVVANVLWVIESAAVLIAGYVAPNALGIAFIVAQAVFVAVLAELEILGLRKLARE